MFGFACRFGESKMKSIYYRDSTGTMLYTPSIIDQPFSTVQRKVRRICEKAVHFPRKSLSSLEFDNFLSFPCTITQFSANFDILCRV